MVRRTVDYAPLPALPPAVAASPLLARGGVDVYEGLIEPRLLERLDDESLRAHAMAIDQGSTEPNPEEDRGGVPLRRFLSGSGGPAQQAFYQSERLRGFLESVAGFPLRPTGSVGTFSYYVRPGDFLDLHRDIVACDVAVITLLRLDGPREDAAGALCVYPERHREPLSAIRETPDEGAFAVEPEVGQTIVLLGGVVPHAIAPIRAGQVRVTSVLCFRGVAESRPRDDARDGCGC